MVKHIESAAHAALFEELNVWLGPELWNATPRRTLSYLTEAAAAAEPLFRRWPDRLTFCVGNELTLFMRGIVPGPAPGHGKPVAITELGSAACRDAEDPKLLGTFTQHHCPCWERRYR